MVGPGMRSVRGVRYLVPVQLQSEIRRPHECDFRVALRHWGVASPSIQCMEATLSPNTTHRIVFCVASEFRVGTSRMNRLALLRV